MIETNGASFRGVVRAGAVVFEDDPGLPEGTPVVVTPVLAARGGPRTILAAVEAGPKVTGEDMDDLLEAIVAGARPIRFASPLD